MPMILKRVKKLNSQINKLMLIFCEKYKDVFTKKNLIKYDEIVELDYNIVHIFQEFCQIVIDTEFSVDFKYMTDNHKTIYENLMKCEKPDLEQIVKESNADGLFYSYLLCQMYILIPFIIFSYLIRIKETKINRELTIKEEYKLYLYKFSFALGDNLKVFKKWDQTETTVNSIYLEEDETIDLLKAPLEMVHKLFKNLFLNYFLVKEWFPNSTKSLSLLNAFTNWKFLLILITVIAVFIALLGLLIYFAMNTNSKG